MSTFTLDLQRFAKNAGVTVDKRVREITKGLLSSIIRRSPVGDPLLWKHKAPKGYVGGRFKGNWQTTQGTPQLGVTARIDPSGMMAIAEMVENIGGAGSITYMTNNLPYAQRLEYDGWSGQAPEGMVRVNMARIEAVLQATKA